MKSIWSTVIGFALSYAAPLYSENIEILTLGGPYHGDEVKPLITKDWLALYKTTEGFELTKVDIVIEQAHDPITDAVNTILIFLTLFP